MAELKTLKDLNMTKFWFEEDMQTLRSEAVNWIKHYDVEAERGSPVAIALSAWINHFFNITDEDLK